MMFFDRTDTKQPPAADDREGKYFDSLVICDEILKGSYLSSLLANTLKSNQVEINTDSKSQRPVARLKEPRDLFTLPKELECAQEAARWPAECQVVDMKVQHIDAMPICSELYYTSTGKEIVVKVIGEEAGQVVYQYNPMSAVNYFTRALVGGNRVSPSASNTSDLKFESRFESGNLAKAVKITDTYYELSIRADLYTNKHMQWFYFMVENTRKGVNYRISIVNLLKGDSLYNEGMRPVMYSCKDAVVRKVGWRRCGTNINYYQNDTNAEDDNNATYTLTFNIEFPYEDDCVFLAHSYPYTYSDLQEYLIKLQNHPVKSQYTKLRLLCKSLAGNNIYYLTVTDNSTDDIQEPKPKKKAVVMTARVHPGESPASWMMKGVIDFITGDSLQAKELREKFIFKLVPMLNPDGVIVGNNRCSLSGRDLNRQYRTVIRETYPSVWYTKVLIKRLIEECGVAMYCDFHAHSRKHNVFIYGCENKRIAEKRLQEQVFPLMLHKNTADKFSFENCKFRINKDKEGTGRVVIWMMGVDNSYTLEASFAGSTLGSRHHTHFTTVDYENMGRSFCETLLDYVDDTPAKLRLRSKIVLKLLREGSSADEPANIELSDYSSDEGELSDLSDDERRRREDHVITAPPPSPVHPSHKKHKPKIPTARLDLDSSQDRESSGDELQVHSAPYTAASSRQVSPKKDSKETNKSPTAHAQEPISMPPELIVTSTSQTQEITVFERLYKPSDNTKGSLAVSKPLSRRGSSKKSPDVRRRKLVRQNGELSDPEYRPPSEVSLPIKKHFWRALSNDNIPWSANYNEHEDLLRACSEKLAELKRRHKIKGKDLETAGTPSRMPTAKRKIKRRAKSMRVERTLTISETQLQLESFKVKQVKPDFKKLDEEPAKRQNKKAAPSRKFRKGGFVSLATINSSNILDLSGDESLETVGTKKKKKKRKILQISRTVKSAVSAVTAVTVTRKDAKKDISKKKI
ncbi:Zinc carboxypeptidase [Nesidiocoris tenuis]|uniref:Zinc carboxypeptidase n=1 Tax=Nesidiocoris tenuis TaxID=355587 RepID=A0ABN7B4H4_9HEMI|nr:Zinc carboxypeptidase [Nesidiocoris tenuis]